MSKESQRTPEYVTARDGGVFASVDISDAGQNQGNIVALHLAPFTEKKNALEWVQHSGLPLEILATTSSQEGRVIIARTALTEREILEGFKQAGQPMKKPDLHTRFDPWKARGSLSIVGQTLQLSSGLLQKGLGWDNIMFAVSNLMANFTNIIFGGEKATDPHQLRFLKNQINLGLMPHLAEGGQLPGVDEQRFALRPESKKKSEHSAFYEFMKRNSVTFGEVGLRMIGALALVFPFKKDNFARMGEKLKTGDVVGAAKAGFNPKTYTGYAGIAYLVGKTIALFSKIPDPYNPTPATGLKKMRERVFFNASSAIETAAAGFLSFDSFANKTLDNNKLRRIGIDVPDDKKVPDLLGGFGGSLFTVGLSIRFFAPFGTREVDMNELKSHISDSVAQLPADKQANALAEITAAVVKHFSQHEKKVQFGQFYADVAADMAKQHQIYLPAQSEDFAPALVQDNAPQPTPPHADQQTKTFANNDLRKESPAQHAGREALTHAARAEYSVVDAAAQPAMA